MTKMVAIWRYEVKFYVFCAINFTVKQHKNKEIEDFVESSYQIKANAHFICGQGTKVPLVRL